MPAPMLSYVPAQHRKTMPPIIASGFICDRGHVLDAIKNGAVAVSTSDEKLWRLNGKVLRG
jgi:glycerol uptake operon antiterminator